MGTPRSKNTSTPLGQFRAEKNITQEDMAQRLGISQESLSLYERGIRKTPLPVMLLFKCIAEADGWEP